MLTLDVDKLQQVIESQLPDLSDEERAAMLDVPVAALQRLLSTGVYDDRRTFVRLLENLNQVDVDGFVLKVQRTALPPPKRKPRRKPASTKPKTKKQTTKSAVKTTTKTATKRKSRRTS